jgi:intein/homing endonuclease
MENIHCVSGDTKILTDKGYFSIENLEGENINVWNGKEFSPTIVKYTNISLLYKIELSNGMSLKCTPKHKWYINIDNQKRTVFTKDLTINHEIYNYDFPTHNNNDSASDDSASPIDNDNDSASNDSLESNNTYDLDLDKYKLEDLINCNSLNLKIKWLNNIILNNSNYNIESQTLEFFDFNLINLQLLLTTMNIKSNIILDYTK